MPPQAEGFLHFIVALPAEAKPLVSHYRLKRRLGEDAFAIFESEGVGLTVSGSGKAAAAAAVGYTRALFGNHRDGAWLNVGIAGHGEAPLGTAWLAHKISDGDTGRRWYPALCFRPHCPSAEIRTVSQPETAYAADCLYDMEASAYIESAARFSTLELVHSLKVVSDNRGNGIAGVDVARASMLVEGAMEIIAHTERTLRQLAAGLPSPPAVETGDWTGRWHFTVQQTLRLEKLLWRWHVLTDHRPPPVPPALPRARDALDWLQAAVEALPVRLTRNPP